ncbi:MAG: sigma-70 family RNA polymerase sigma factor [Planctomycetota bacterium]
MNFDSTPSPTSVLVSHSDWLRTILLARLHDRHLADDVIQEVSVAAVRHVGSFRSVEEVKAWLYRVAVRQANLIYRRERRQRDRIADYAQTQRAAPSAEYLDRLSQHESGDVVRQAIGNLRPIDRQVLTLKYQHGWSCRRMAAELGVSETTVQSRLLRARRRLRAILMNHEFFSQTNNDS